MDVIPYMLSEEDVMSMTEHQLELLASCSTDVIIDKIFKYLMSNSANTVCQAMVRSAYNDRLQTMKFLESKKTAKCVEMLQQLSYSSITPMVGIEELQMYKKVIEYILGSKYAIPYVPPISGDIVNELIADLKESGNENVRAKIKALSQFLKDSPHKKATGTIVKNIIRNKGTYELLLKGIDFMIEKKQIGANPASWRYL